ADAVGVVEAAGVVSFVEVGPGSVLSGMVADSVAEGSPAVGVPLLRKGRDEETSLVTGLAQLHARGVTVDWEAFFAGQGAERIDLPTYAFRRHRYWLESDGPAGAAPDHPLLTQSMHLAESGGLLFTGRLAVGTHPWLADHMVDNNVLFPGAGFVEMAIRAGDEVGCGRIDELTLETPLILTARGSAQVQLTLEPADGNGARRFSVHARTGADVTDGSWTRHATGLLTGGTGKPPAGLEQWPPRGARSVAVDGFYDDLAEGGLRYGPAFQGVRAAWRRGEEMFAEVVLPGSVGAEAGRFGVHPVLLDAALHVVALRGGGLGEVVVPFAWSGVELFASGASRVRVRVSPVDAGGVRVEIADALGVPVGLVESLVVRSLGEGLVPGAGSGVDGLFGVEWVRAEEGAAGSGVGSGSGGGVSWGELGEVLSGVGVVPDVVVLRVGSGA
ncbi:polyketide synthase dehydratase domain-containing protein, partial [Streptomyces ardesiacus]|uniref:polyketide synthase dehydratase domain-containing protein n=1 Tax=Streptomyces ardesiacus TaxID=285564 RepID=UPI0036B868B8